MAAATYYLEETGFDSHSASVGAPGAMNSHYNSHSTTEQNHRIHHQQQHQQQQQQHSYQHMQQQQNPFNHSIQQQSHHQSPAYHHSVSNSESPMYTTHHSNLSGLAISSASSPRSFPAFDPESPFNSPFVPIKNIGRDGRLKTKLMGIGVEGGYLTSPLIGGNLTRNSARPQIAIDSPVPTPGTNAGFVHHDSHLAQEHGPLTNLAPRTSSLAARNNSMTELSSNSIPSDRAMTGMGIAIAGLNAELELGDYRNPATQLVANGQSRGRMASSSYHNNTMSSSFAEDDAVEVADLIETTSPVKAATPKKSKKTPTVDSIEPTKFAESPATAANPTVPATTPKNKGRPRKNLSIKTLNKAKSCSALSVEAQKRNGEPLTPVSSHSKNFVVPGVPFNSPLDDALAQSADPGAMPFSFADLYTFGLGPDPADPLDARKSPYQFANDLLSADGSVAMGLGLSSDGSYLDDQEYQPTPSFAYGSGFTSPSASSRSGPSPDLSNDWASPHNLSSAPMMQAPSMLSAPSMESAYSLPLPANVNSGRQRCATYHAQGSASLDPALVSPGHGRQASAGAVYGNQNTKFAYPSRFQGQVQAPAMTWANSVPPSQSQTPYLGQQSGPYSNAIDTTMFIPRFQNARDQLESLDDMYERLSAASTGYSTPGKRGREFSEDEADFDEDHTPRAARVALTPSAPGSPSPHKKLRTVASAPCLPSRRMRPGPKPKPTKSPQDQHQSVFSAHLSPPPIPQLAQFARSETGGDDEDEADEEEGGPRRNGSVDPQSALPKEVIQSLYESVPACVDEAGNKVSKRYRCLMDDCGRTFPRKSAIESHIQTHLEDKPFVCPYDDCDASFVRQHDLRRHERIHSGNKPFPCPCGKGFARGDALARHRARGICEGSLVPMRKTVGATTTTTAA